MKVVLISCASKKYNARAKAKDLYLCPLFRMSMNYALSLNPDKIFILSAKYGLLDLEQEIEPYNLTLNSMKAGEIKKWAEGIISRLRNKVDFEKDEFIFLAGEKYRKYLIGSIKNYEVPLQGQGIGKQLKFLKESLK